MENASKALLMAGGVLIALMIIGALLLMFNNLSSYQNEATQTTREAQVVDFNKQYETYNRNNVRGSDLYSLLNKVVDYNRRQSTEGIGTNDQGQYLAYEPMSIEVNLASDSDLTSFSADGNNRLITNENIEVSGRTNYFESYIKGNIDELESTYGEDSLTNLTTGLTRIFIDDRSSDQQKQDAVNAFNNVSSSVKANSYDDIKAGSEIRKDIYTYYEYVQFKRAHFNCTGTEYNNQTGRITKMVFEFNGSFN